MNIFEKLSSLIGDTKQIKISDISYLPEFQTMFRLCENEVEKIASSMRESGFDRSHPIHVWNHDGKYIVVDGHTRIAAALKAGLSEVPAVIHDFENSDSALLYAYEQQTNRRNLSDLELLMTIEKMDQLKPKGNHDEGTLKGRSNELLAGKLGISPRQVSKFRAVIKGADEAIKGEIKAGTKSVNQAYNEIKGVEVQNPVEKKTGTGSICKFCSPDGRCMKVRGCTK